MRIHAKWFARAARSFRSPSDAASTSDKRPRVRQEQKEPQTPGCRRNLVRCRVALLPTLLWVVRTFMGPNQASAAPPRPDRAPYSESAIQLAQATQRTSGSPLRLRSGTYLPAGATELNLARAWAALADA